MNGSDQDPWIVTWLPSWVTHVAALITGTITTVLGISKMIEKQTEAKIAPMVKDVQENAQDLRKLKEDFVIHKESIIKIDTKLNILLENRVRHNAP